MAMRLGNSPLECRTSGAGGRRGRWIDTAKRNTRTVSRFRENVLVLTFKSATGERSRNRGRGRPAESRNAVKISRILRRTWLALALSLTAFGSLSAQPLPQYNERLVRELFSPAEIRSSTSIQARLRRTSSDVTTFYRLSPIPFDEIATAPKSSAHNAPTQTSWSLPPWPSLDPPLPETLSPELQRALRSRAGGAELPDAWPSLGLPHPDDISEELRLPREGQWVSDDRPEIWGELDASSPQRPSALLRPLPASEDQRFEIVVTEIPDPFSIWRYYDEPNAFVELAAYGGSSSFKAEEAFLALREATTGKESLEGIGHEAFLARIEITEDPPEPEPDFTNMPPPFEDLDPLGGARPDLLDSGTAAALTSPSFKDLPVADLEGRRVSFRDPVKEYRRQHPRVLSRVVVLVAFFPEQRLTLSLAVEERLGTVQDLIALGLLAQRKLRGSPTALAD